MANRLATESSPYLLQHKDNPVDWFPWGSEALEFARAHDKPLLVSIGYSACHWCHVMAHESFENEAIAAEMNDSFVNIKVDREERPDLDSIYMTAVQAMTGHGGWPLNVFITPDGVPFYGGTYWPPADRQGMPSFLKVLQAVSDAYQDKREEVLANAEQIRDFITKASTANPQRGELGKEILDRAVQGLARQFDGEHGGFGSAPKFPQPSVIEFLLRRVRSSSDQRAEAMVRLSLDRMAAGGMYDLLGGGFHRYSVDAVWLVPHFEKMLYDNAQLARNYIDAFRLFGDPDYAHVAVEILDFVVREMRSDEGGFYSTLDADSEGKEGTYYVWPASEFDQVVGAESAAPLRALWGVTEPGNFEGENILHVARSEEEVAGEFELTEELVSEMAAAGREALLAARAERVRPGRDEKVLAGWNGMMLRVFAEASRTFDRADYREVAEANASFLLEKMTESGRLLHTYRDGSAKIGGFLEDYANVIDGLLALYEATFDLRWLKESLRLAERMIEEFGDDVGGGFFDTARSAEELIARPRDMSDGATPAGSSVAASVLLKLSRMTERADLETLATTTLQLMTGPMAEQPLGFGRFLAGVDAYLETAREVAIVGRRDDPAVAALASTVFERFEPNAVLGLVDTADEEAVALMPFLAHRPAKDGQATAYLCERHACLPPVTSAEDLIIQLEQGTGISWQEF